KIAGRRNRRQLAIPQRKLLRQWRIWRRGTWRTIGISRSFPSSDSKADLRSAGPHFLWTMPPLSPDGARMRFDLTDLSLFRHVVEAGSITGGAERAHLALAAASTRIRNMEETLGAALLVRGRQGVTPTQAGRTLLQHARAMLRQAERLREDLGAY